MHNQNFTDYAHVSIYNFCDVMYKAKARAAAKRLFKAGLASSPNPTTIGEECYAKYEAMVVEYATEHLPKEYELRHDYYGAKCISNDHGWRAPKTGLYDGDSMGRIMWFDSHDALEQYTREKLDIIQHEQEVADTR